MKDLFMTSEGHLAARSNLNRICQNRGRLENAIGVKVDKELRVGILDEYNQGLLLAGRSTKRMSWVFLVVFLLFVLVVEVQGIVPCSTLPTQLLCNLCRGGCRWFNGACTGTRCMVLG